MRLRLVGLDICHRHGLDAPGMVDQDLGVLPELAEERLCRGMRKLSHRVYPHLGETPRDARADAPEVRERPMVTERRPEALLVELAEEVIRMLCRDIEGNLCEVGIRAKAAGRGDPCLLCNFAPERLAELACGHPIERQIGRDIEEGLVDRVDEDVFRSDLPEVDAVDLGRLLHVVAHAGRSHDVIDAFGNLEHATAPRDPELLHRRRNSQTYRFLGARGVCYH